MNVTRQVGRCACGPDRLGWRRLKLAHPALTILINILAVQPTLVSPAQGVTLQDAWSAGATPGEGYDNVLHLDSLTVYTGGLRLDAGTNCIHGHGAILDLEGDQIRALMRRTILDIDGCVLVNGPVTPRSAALAYVLGACGRISNCVFYGNRWGLHMNEINVAVSGVHNCIFMNNTEWGAVLDDVFTPPVSHCAAYENGVGMPPGEGGHYALWCGCSSLEPEEYVPPPESSCLICDPLFVHVEHDPRACDFHLEEASPCRGAGDPPGIHIGVYQEGAAPVAECTWGAIKVLYRSSP